MIEYVHSTKVDYAHNTSQECFRTPSLLFSMNSPNLCTLCSSVCNLKYFYSSFSISVLCPLSSHPSNLLVRS